MYEGLDIQTPDMSPDEMALPNDIEAEQAVLGAIILDGAAFDQVDDNMHGGEFYLEKHKKIFSAMRKVKDKDEPIDIITIGSELREDIELVGGYMYLTDLGGSTPSAADVMSYVAIVKERYIHRTALLEIRKLAAQSWKTGTGAEVIANMHLVSSALSDSVAPKKEFTTMRDALVTVMDDVESVYTNRNHSGVTGIESGFPDLDKMTAGFQKSDLIIIAARPSVGKTALALNIAQNVGIRGKKTVAVFSLEMSTSQLVKRMICAEANIDASRMRTGFLLEDDWEKMSVAIGTLSNANIFIDDSAMITANEIRSKCRRLQKEHGLDMIVIDYLQLIQGSNRSRRENRQQEVSEISRTLKQIAKELDVPVVALSQLSRAVEQRQDKRPMMSDLRESGSIEQDADIVAFLYRDDYYNPESEKKNIIEIIISKQRNGPTGTVKLVFLKNFNKFASIDHGHQSNYDPDKPTPQGRDWAG